MASDSSFSLQKISKKSWSSEEDSKLLLLIDELGAQGSWSVISNKFGNRSGKQCRERYHNHLKPDITKKTFTKEEDALVNKLQQEMGNQWAKISKFFNGRSDNAVKNRWHIINRGKTVPPADLRVIAPAITPRNAPVIITPPSNGSTATRQGPYVPKLNIGTMSVSPTSICTSTSSKSTSSTFSSSSSSVPTPSLHHHNMHSTFSFPNNHGADLQSLYSGHDGHHHELLESPDKQLHIQKTHNKQHLGLHLHTISNSFDSCDNDPNNEDNWIDDLLKSHIHPTILSIHSHPQNDPLHLLKVDDWSCDGDDDGPLSYSKDRLKSLLSQNVFAEGDHEDSIVSPTTTGRRNDLDEEEEEDYFSPSSRYKQHHNSRVYDTFSEGALSARSDEPSSTDNEADDLTRSGVLDESHIEEEGDDLFLLFDDNMSLCDSAKPSPYNRNGGWMSGCWSTTSNNNNSEQGGGIFITTHNISSHNNSNCGNNGGGSANIVRSTRCSPANPNVKRHRGMQPGGSPFGRNHFAQVPLTLNVI